MRFLLPLFVAIAVCAAGVIDNPSSGIKNNDGSNKYLLYTRQNPLVPKLLSGTEQSIAESNVDLSKDTVFYAHGWNGDSFGEDTTELIIEAFLQDKDVNVIVLDWGLAIWDYITAKREVVAAGRNLGEFINLLTTLGLEYEKIHLVGFSLGGHLVGIAGRTTTGKVQRITGLDPAARMWTYDNNRLARTDAKYVEVIHTNTILYGFSEPLGDADFYPNGGDSMPGCFTNACSHARAVRYMASSLKHNQLTGNKCSFLAATSATGALCRGDGNTYHMGNSDLNKALSGIFRVNTRSILKFYIIINHTSF